MIDTLLGEVKKRLILFFLFNGLTVGKTPKCEPPRLTICCYTSYHDKRQKSFLILKNKRFVVNVLF